MNFKNKEDRKVINHVSTRWLSLEKCLVRTLMPWDAMFSKNIDAMGLFGVILSV